MIFKSKAGEEREVSESVEGLNPEQEPELYESIRDFRLSVCAWSEAATNRPRAVVETRRRWSWRLATALALGCVLIAVGVSGGIYEHLHRQLAAGWQQHQQEAQTVAPRAVETDRPAVTQRSQPVREEEEDLLAKVDSDVSRQVPVAMEPLAQLMAGEVTR